jgi:hypothetical protein
MERTFDIGRVAARRWSSSNTRITRQPRLGLLLPPFSDRNEVKEAVFSEAELESTAAETCVGHAITERN